MTRPFVHLHNHSDFSLLDGASRVDDIVELAARYKMPAVALTDHGNMFGAVSFFKAAKRHGVKPILGCEIYVAPKSRLDKSVNGSVSDTNNHLVLLAETNEGYKNLVKLVTAGYLEGFYYKPRIDKELLAQHAKGLIGLSACLKGEVPQAALRGDESAAVRAAGVYRDILGKDNFFLEIQDHGLGLREEKAVNESLFALARKEGMKTVATNDCHYISRDDAEAHDILLCIGTGKKSQDQGRMRYPGDQFYFKSSEEMAALFEGYREAYDNTLAIAERVGVDLDRERQDPRFHVPEGYTADSYFEEKAWEGFRERWRTHGSAIEAQGRFTLGDYEARLKREIAMIQTMGFPSYFLIVWDFIRFAKERGIPVGPGRGSAAGSLVAYALRITDIDPLEHDLIFERFLNPERVTMPDIDIDFCEARRGEVIEYVTRKYGRDNVAQIITFGTMKAKAVVRDVARVMDLSYADADKIAKMIPFDLKMTLEKALQESPPLLEAYQKDPKVKELIDVSKRLEGTTRHAS
ncbi:MAG TPA: DNA polymerase III subunit alpha, partial [Vicinamibacteria bacterium]